MLFLLLLPLDEWMDGGLTEKLAVLKEHMKEGTGVWKVRRRERSGVIEVFRVEESGTGDILSREFVEWRTGGGAALGKQGEADGIHG